MTAYIQTILPSLNYYKQLGESTFSQLTDEQLFWKPEPTSNSIAIIVHHLSGNMCSRWTNFLSEDGEKSWRNRDQEFQHVIKKREDLITHWHAGWNCFLGCLEALTESDLSKTVYIRSQAHSVMEAINRQLTHYPYHVGQIVLLGKIQKGASWKSLSIPIGGSDAFNKSMLEKSSSGN